MPPGHAPGQERLAALYLKNSAERNHADPRLEPAQTRVDTAIAKAHERGDSTHAIGGIGEAVRQRVAEQIRTGGKAERRKRPRSRRRH